MNEQNHFYNRLKNTILERTAVLFLVSIFLLLLSFMFFYTSFFCYVSLDEVNDGSPISVVEILSFFAFIINFASLFCLIKGVHEFETQVRMNRINMNWKKRVAIQILVYCMIEVIEIIVLVIVGGQ